MSVSTQERSEIRDRSLELSKIHYRFLERKNMRDSPWNEVRCCLDSSTVFIVVINRMFTHSSCILRKDCNIVKKTACLATTLAVSRVVVGGWKSLVFTILIQ